MKEYRMINDPVYCNYPININGSACHGEILDAIWDRLDDCLTRHTRVLIVRLDLTLPINVAPEANSVFSKFLWGLRLVLGGEPLRYIWVAERNNSSHQHFHLVLFENGQQHRSGYRIWQEATLAWGKVLRHPGKGLVNVATPSIEGAYCNYGVVLDKNAPGFSGACEQAHYWLSYMAKVNTKTTEMGHPYGASRLG